MSKSKSIVGNYKRKYNFESNSQPSKCFLGFVGVGNYKRKYNFESNSQLKRNRFEKVFSWEL